MRDLRSAANYFDYSGYEPFVLSIKKTQRQEFCSGSTFSFDAYFLLLL